MASFRRKKQAPRNSAMREQPPSAPMFSYHAQRSSATESERKQPNQESKQKRSPKFFHHIPTYFALLVILAALIYSTTLSTKPKVVILGNEPSSSILRGDASTYQKLIQSQLNNSLFNRSKLTLDTNKLTRELKQQYPEFSDLAVVIPLIGRRPVIQVKPTQAVFVLTNSNGSYLIDKEGKAILEVQAGSNANKAVPTVVDQTSVAVKVGQNVLPKETLSFMTEVIGQMQAKNIPIESMTLPALANELHVKVSGQPHYIKFNMEGDARQQVGTYIALMEKLATDKITPGEYVDVRVDEKAFYR